MADDNSSEEEQLDLFSDIVKRELELADEINKPEEEKENSDDK